MSKNSGAEPANGICGTSSQEHQFLKAGKDYSIQGMLQEKTVWRFKTAVWKGRNCQRVQKTGTDTRQEKL